MGGSESKKIDYNEPISQNKEKGFSHIYRNPKFKNELTNTPDPSFRTYRDVVLKSCFENFPNKALAGRIIVKKEIKDGVQVENRQVQSFTYKECFEKAQMLGKAILGMKLEFKEPIQGMKFIGIYSKNRVEWLFADLVCTLYGLTSVPLYDTLGMQNLSYCLKQTEMTSLFLSADTLKILLTLKDHGSLKNLILFDKIDQQTLKKANSLGFNVLDFQALMTEGKRFPNINYKDIIIEPNNIHTFSYTSGTTGPPKGAMLSHQNFLAFLAAFNNHPARFHEQDTYLSFLPLPHVFQRVCICACVYAGTFVAFYSGDVTKIKNDAQCVKPTLFIAVPRLFNKIVEKVQQGFNEKTGIAKCLVSSGVNSKLQNIQKTGNYKSGFYDSVIFSKTRQAFGGRVRLMISGSAPISKKTYEFMQMIMCCPLYEGYGQTQNTAAAFIRTQDDPVLGHVGSIISSLEFKLFDIPQMKYTSDDKDEQGKSIPRGQIWLRGPAVFAGYYKMKEQTEETITKDGWLKTGDVGMLLPDSRGMKIIDRKKNIFKLQQGEYVAPDKVQAVYSKCPYVEQVFLHGQSTHNFCVAIIKPHKDHLLQLAAKNKIKGSYEQLVNNKQIKLILIKELFNEGKKGGLNSLEQAKNIYLEKLPFMEKNILTNTMKLQRFQAKNLYKSIIEELYRQGQLPVK